MNYSCARQIKDKWFYTTNGFPTGNCSPYDVCKDCDGRCTYRSDIECNFCCNKGLVNKSSPCLGHDTAEEACEHQRQYEIDKVRYSTDKHTQRKCQICESWTQNLAWLDYNVYYLCENHCNRDSLEKIVKPFNECWFS
jgi:hypothetical protein